MKLNYPRLTDEKFTETILSFLSSLKPLKQRLTPTEIEFLSEFINLAPKYRSQMFSTLSKNKVIKSLEEKGHPTNIANVNVKIYGMVKKGYLKRDEDSVIILSPTISMLIEKFKSNNRLDIELNFIREKTENTTNN